jgi:hypothetical protein
MEGETHDSICDPAGQPVLRTSQLHDHGHGRNYLTFDDPRDQEEWLCGCMPQAGVFTASQAREHLLAFKLPCKDEWGRVSVAQYIRFSIGPW